MKNDAQTIIKRAMQRQDEITPEATIQDNKVSKKQKLQVFIFSCSLILIVWASLAEIAITVAIRGEIIQEFDIEKIQHLEGGILEELYIKEGDHVYAGQKIAQLKGKDRDSELGTIQIEIIGLKLEIQHLDALINNTMPNQTKNPNISSLASSAHNNWEKEFYKNQSNDNLVQHDINHKTRLIKSMKIRLISANKQLGLIQEQLKIKEDLYKEEVASYVDVLNMRVQESNMIREIENLNEAILNEKFENMKLSKQLRDTRLTRNSEYLKILYDLKKQLDIKSSQLPQVADKVKRLSIYSPIEGMVDKVHFNYKSAIISPGESIADITHMRGRLVAEAKIPRKDIGFIEVGQVADIKIDTYAFTKYGSIEGEIKSISRASYEEKEEKFYFAKFELRQNYLERNGVRFHISPNMEFTANIKTGSRQIIEYMIKPVMNAIEESFDER